jgi:hypothetical protein
VSSASTTNTDSSTALVLFRDDSVRERTLVVALFALLPLRPHPILHLQVWELAYFRVFFSLLGRFLV